MEGQLSENPLAELAAEITDSELSGVLRLNRDPIKVAVYFDQGTLIYASSNLRAHRLENFLRKALRVNGAATIELPHKATDDQLAGIVIDRGLLTKSSLDSIRQEQASEILRLALLWTDGRWNFDARIRLAENLRVDIDLRRLLLECSRHLPVDFVHRRADRVTGTLSAAANDGGSSLNPEESLLLSRAAKPGTLVELKSASGLPEERALRAAYGLWLAGYIYGGDRNGVFPVGSRASKRPAPAPPPADRDEQAELQKLFARLETAADNYEVLNVSRTAGTEEIKHAYHELARRYHPDRFHHSGQLRARLESAFARMAQAYDTLGDQSLRAVYDKRTAVDRNKPQSSTEVISKGEAAFQKGTAALQQGRQADALRFFAEASMLEPRTAPYRAAYGRALIADPKTRRLAESELQAAIALEPANPAHRISLAELYQQNGLRRRAVGELERALSVDPGNENARALLAKLKK